jgi:hypothetical protein
LFSYTEQQSRLEINRAKFLSYVATAPVVGEIAKKNTLSAYY